MRDYMAFEGHARGAREIHFTKSAEKKDLAEAMAKYRQRGQLRSAEGKDFDTGNFLGPCIVTADEIGDA